MYMYARVDDLTIQTLVASQKVQTQVRWKKRSDQGLPSLLFRSAFLKSSPDNQHLIWEL